MREREKVVGGNNRDKAKSVEMRTKYFSEARTSSRIQLSFGAASNQKLERNKKNAENEKRRIRKYAEHKKIDKFIWDKKSLKIPN